jgi:hypothetical protein
MEALEVRRVQHSEDLAKPGEYVFIAKRDPKVTVESNPLMPPSGFWRSLWWSAFGKKVELKQIVEVQWPAYDAIIIDCPQCNQPCATTAKHAIVSVEPLTIETAVTCPYCRTITFKVTDGKLITA